MLAIITDFMKNELRSSCLAEKWALIKDIAIIAAC